MGRQEGRPRPPAVWRRILAAVLPREEREATLGELEEMYHERVERTGVSGARSWYRRQAAGFLARGWWIGRSRRARDGGGRAMGWWDALLRDLRWAVRGMVRRPAHAGVVIATMALGIGAASAVFALADAHLFEDLPYGDPEELVLVWETDRSSADVSTVSPGSYWAWREQAASFEDIAAFNVDLAVLSGEGAAEQVTASVVTPNFFDVLRVEPLLGSGFSEGAARASDGRLVMLGHGLWTRRYGADPGLVGTRVRVGGEPHTVVGVLPPDFRQPERRLTWQGTELWRPMRLEDRREDFGSRSLRTVARREAGVPLERARAEMDALAARLAEDHPAANAGRGALVYTLPEYLLGDALPLLFMLLGAAAAVILLVSANVANLTLARGEERRREFALRAALGSGGARLLRHVVAESVLLALAGAGVGLVLVLLSRDLLQAVQERYFSALIPVDVDLRVVLGTVAVAGLAGLLSSVPLGRVARGTELRDALIQGGRGGSGDVGEGRTRSLLVVGQIALATSLVAVAALLARSFGELVAVEPGFRPSGVVTLPIQAPPGRYRTHAEVEAFNRELWRTLEEVPGVVAASLVSDLPFTGENRSTEPRVDGVPFDPENPPRSEYRMVFPEYFSVMGIPLERGSLPASGWEVGDPVSVVVNERLAETWWPDRDPVGRTFTLTWSEPIDVVVSGVVADVLDDGYDAAVDPLFYLPWAAAPNRYLHAVARVQGDPSAVMADIRAAVSRFEPDLPVSELRRLDGVMSDTLMRPRAASLIGGFFALVALLVAAAGIYGVLSLSVQSRTRELGIRAALGASSTTLVSMVLGQTGRLVTGGLILGVAGALAAGTMLSGVLFQVPAGDPPSLLAAVAVLGGVAFLAAWIPARRATRVDPRNALDAE